MPDDPPQRHDPTQGSPSSQDCPSRPDLFGDLATWISRAAGGKWAFLLALATVLVWGASGPYYHFSNVWQLVINTSTTIVTFLMVFLIQNAQNRESKAIHIKLDELIRAVQSARNEVIDVERKTEEELDRLAEEYRRLARDSKTSNASKITEITRADPGRVD